MTTTTSSADPQALFHYADTATQINGDLEHEAQVLGTVLDRFAATCTEYRFGVGSHLADDLRAYVQQIRPLDEWVWQVGIDFQHADQRGEVDNAPPPAQQKPSLWDRMTDRAGDLVDQAKEFEDRFGDTIHGVLDVAGMIPVVGEVADGLNAAYYLAEGDYKNAAISAAGMLPGGQAATGARLAVKVAGAAAGAGAAAAAARRAARHADDVVDGAQGANRAGDIAKAGDEAEDVLYKRPSGFRKSTHETMRENGPKNAEGEMICPTCGRNMSDTITVETKNGSVKRRGYDGDHYPTTWAERVRDMQSREVKPTRKEVLDEYNRDVRAQCPPCNQGHRYEGKPGEFK